MDLSYSIIGAGPTQEICQSFNQMKNRGAPMFFVHLEANWLLSRNVELRDVKLHMF